MLMEGNERTGWYPVLFTKDMYVDGAYDTPKLSRECSEKLQPYVGMTVEQMMRRFGYIPPVNPPKHLYRHLIEQVLGRPREFLGNAGISCHVFTSYMSRQEEHVPFPKFGFEAIKETPWEKSWLRETCMGEFLFIEFLDKSENPFSKPKDYSEVVFRKFLFWRMPPEDLLEVQKVYERTRKVIMEGVKIFPVVYGGGKVKYGSNLPGPEWNAVCHARVHAGNEDYEDVDGKKLLHAHSFWLGSDYVKDIMMDHEPSLF